MPLTGLTFARLKENIRKYAVVYIAGIIVCLLLSDIVYTSTRPMVPAEREVMTYVVDYLPNVDPLADLAAQTLAELQPQDETLESVVFYNLMFNDPEQDYNSAMLLMTRMAAADCDIYIASNVGLQYLINSGICLPLEEYLESGWMEGLDLHPITCIDPETETSFIGALSLDKVEALDELGVMTSIEGSGLVIAANGTNQASSMKAAETMIRTLMEGDYVQAHRPESAD